VRQSGAPAGVTSEIRALRAGAAAGEITPEALRTLGELLHDCVRVEKRELFEETERIPPAAGLKGVRP
jgi:hypothetical protein